MEVMRALVRVKAVYGSYESVAVTVDIGIHDLIINSLRHWRVLIGVMDATMGGPVGGKNSFMKCESHHKAIILVNEC